jgi:hypothetical protein
MAHSIQKNTNSLRREYQLIEKNIPGATQTEREGSSRFGKGGQMSLQMDVGSVCRVEPQRQTVDGGNATGF